MTDHEIVALWRQHKEVIGFAHALLAAERERLAQPEQGPVVHSGADENPPVFARRWAIAADGFGLQRDDDGPYVHIDDALSVLHQWMRATPPQPAQPAQEPVAWKDKTYGNLHHQDFGNSIPLYTSPPASKPWVGLTDEEIERACVPLGTAMLSFMEVARAIEAKLREKNT